MELEEIGVENISLMDGERIDSALDLTGGSGEGFGSSPKAMLLTDKRVIHIHGNSKHRSAEFASIQDVDAAEISYEGEGNSAFFWAALAIVVAILLYLLFDNVADNSAARIAAPIFVALMGVYLIVDRLTSPCTQLVVFKAGSAQIRCEPEKHLDTSDIYGFINRLFQLKEENGPGGASRVRNFAPR